MKTTRLLLNLPIRRELLRLFVNPELIKWSGLCEIYEKDLRATEVFTDSTKGGSKRWAELRKRVVEHVSVNVSFCFDRQRRRMLIIPSSRSVFFYRILELWRDITQKSR